MSEDHDRLDSWKAIADFLDRDPTTVMRWAKERGLPVHAVPGEGQRRRAVYAFKSEIDEWLRNPTDHGSQSMQTDRRDSLAQSDGTDAEELNERDAARGNRLASEAPEGVPREAFSSSANGLPATPHPAAEEEGPRLDQAAASREGDLASLRMTSSTKGLKSSRTDAWRKLWPVFSVGVLLFASGTLAWLAGPLPEPKVLKSDQITSDGRAKGEGIATDGARIYFIEQAPTGWVIAQVSAYGGDPVPIASTTIDSDITDISTDHRELLLVQGRQFGPGSLEVVPLYGEESRPFGNIHAYSASWSPDGATLAYTNDDGLYLCSRDGSDSRRIVSLTGLMINLHWSPNGNKLCFTRGEHSEPSLWEVDRDGKGLTRVFPEFQPGAAGSYGLWTPSGKYLVTNSVCAGHPMPSVVRLSPGLLDRSPGEPACLEFGPPGMAVLAISPDGARLFGLASPAGHPQMEEYDSHTRQFRPYLPDISAGYADFSKDGQRVAFVTGGQEVTGASSLWVSQIDGSHKVQITRPPLLVQLPRWSPDAKWIAFMGKDPGKSWRVRVVPADGGSYAPVTPVGNEEGAPTWAPDSTQIAFGGMTQPAERTEGRLVIHVFNLKTGQLSSVPGSEGLWTARWSPDGRYMSALTQDSRSLMLYDFRARRWAKLATMAKIPDVVWSRHEEAIYFNGEVTAGDRAVFRVKIPGGRLEHLAGLAGRAESDWLGLTPDDCPLIARNPATQEIYALTVKWP